MIQILVTKRSIHVWIKFLGNKMYPDEFGEFYPNPEYGQSQPTEYHQPMDWLGMNVD
jgi:hypothetical protein